ncbi:uncharacterized protein LOC110870907 [Helianthus annuus]|uniref:uncharacterized protein LOC110870907 n=1 Tax=Helianthus annuus TaxID=4232 RepID=UPI000B9029F9|nr:uncharacterized protein LOC110870907 [Helianthus annuus]XP_035840429.1 uncharacterized protein LOC110870907 [Helianthus annuus]
MKRDALYAVPQKGREAEPMCPATAVKRARASNDKKDRRIRVLKQGGSANGASCFNHIGWENVFNYSISFYRAAATSLAGMLMVHCQLKILILSWRIKAERR